MKFTRMLPALLTRTDVVLEIRDSRLPLTSVNRTLEGAVSFLLALVSASLHQLSVLIYCRSFAEMEIRTWLGPYGSDPAYRECRSLRAYRRAEQAGPCPRMGHGRESKLFTMVKTIS